MSSPLVGAKLSVSTGDLAALGGALALLGRVWRGFRARFPKTQQEGFA